MAQAEILHATKFEKVFKYSEDFELEEEDDLS